MKNIHGSGGTAGSSLHAAALSMARGASGVWLRAVCRLGLLCRGTVYLLVGYLALRLALASHGRAGAPVSSAGAVQAADVWRRVPLVLLVAGLGAYALTQRVGAVAVDDLQRGGQHGIAGDLAAAASGGAAVGAGRWRGHDEGTFPPGERLQATHHTLSM